MTKLKLNWDNQSINQSGNLKVEEKTICIFMDDIDFPPVIFPSDSTGDPKACKDIRPRIAKHMAKTLRSAMVCL